MTRVAPITRAPTLLRDGAALALRATTPADADALALFYERAVLPLQVGRVTVPAAEAMARWAVSGAVTGVIASAASAVVAHGCIAVSGPLRGQLIVSVLPAWRHRGLASDLLEPLLLAAEQAGLESLKATMPAGDLELLHVLEDAGLDVTVSTSASTLEVELPVRLDPETIARFERRQRRAAVAGLDHLLRPHSVVVVGASDHRGSVGGEVVRNLRAARFGGALHVVRPRGGSVAGIPALASPEELPTGVDVGVVAVPAEAVLEAARSCVRAGVRGLAVLSAGFAERGPAGVTRQRELLDLCRGAGVRLIGPNSLGVVTTDPAVRFHATFAPQHVTCGRIALASQSGAIGIMAMDATARRGLGLSSFVSLGNRADVSSNDLLRYWRDDPHTDVIALYLESLGNPRTFAQVAREVSSAKPIVVVKAGRSGAGRRAAASHTGALVETSDGLIDELLREAGVMRVDTAAEMLDVAAVLTASGRPRGARIAVLTNAGGAGVACADAADAAGLQLPSLDGATTTEIARVRPQASTGNPVDLVADATPDAFTVALGAIAADRSVDAVVAIHVPPVAGVDDDTPERVAAAVGELAVPIVLVPLAQDVDRALASRVAILPTPEDAARALGRIASYSRRLASPPDPSVRQANVDRLRAATVVSRGLAEGGGWLAPELAAELVECYGIPLVPARQARDASTVEHVARSLRAPLALKAVLPGLPHKTEHGAVRLGLATAVEAGAAAAAMAVQLAGEGLSPTGFVVQEMLSGGVEVLVGAVNDPTFGPLVLCGAGGVNAEVWDDVQTRFAPVGPRTAQEMVTGMRCSALLRGWRGLPAADIESVENIVVRMAALIADRPEVAEIECNPVLALPDRAVAVDLRVRLEEGSS